MARLDRLELAADAVRGVGLHVEGVDVRRAAALVQEDDVLGPGPDGPTTSEARSRCGRSRPANPATPRPSSRLRRVRRLVARKSGQPRFMAHRPLADRSVPGDSSFDTAQCRSRNSLLFRIAQATSSHALRRSGALGQVGRGPPRVRSSPGSRPSVGEVDLGRGSSGRRAPTCRSRPIRLSWRLEAGPDGLAVDELEGLRQGGRRRSARIRRSGAGRACRRP